MAEVTAKYVSQKINRIRWKPRPQQSFEKSEVFITGGCDDEENKLSVWTVNNTNLDSSGFNGDTTLSSEPRLMCDTAHPGDVTDMQCLSQDHILAASSVGSLTLYRHHTNTQTLGIVHRWENLHRVGGLSCSCTCVAARNDDVMVTGGEDGCICLLNMSQKQPVSQNNNVGSCTVNSLVFLKQLEVLSVNSQGQLKIYDLREKLDEPSKLFSIADDHTPFHCVDKHPSQPHIVAIGTADGSLCIWDLRQENRPLSVLAAHSSSLWEVKFHPHNSNHLFTCSEDGSLWHWDVSSIHMPAPPPLIGTGVGSGGGSIPSFGPSGSMNSNPWLSLEVSQQHLNVTSLATCTLSANTLDIEGQTLLCGTDNESILTINLPELR